ncbi:MAG: hypothetical protein E7630_00280 [Ruminococcaceae bacterium]|nr:hypothetical protein [Oscillospiraceae bacterium]
MKKLLVLFLTLFLLLALTACDGNDEGPIDEIGSGEGTDESSSSADGSNADPDESASSADDSDAGSDESSSGADDSEVDPDESASSADDSDAGPDESAESSGEEDDSETVESSATEEPHTHSYSSKVTKKATCTDKGEKTYTCSCGDTYTEAVKAKGHSWGSWKLTTPPSHTAKGEQTRTCKNCSAAETKDVDMVSLDDIFKDYPELIYSLGQFESVSELGAYDVFEWTTNTVHALSSDIDMENGIFAHTYSLAELNAHTRKYLGLTYRGEDLAGTHFDGVVEITYNASKGQVTVTYYGGFGSGAPDFTYQNYTTEDDIHFTVHYVTSDEEEGTIGVEYRDGNYIIVSHQVVSQ